MKLRNKSIISVSRRSHFNNLTKEFGLFHCLLCPGTSVKISSFLDQEVVRNHTELKRRAATEENDRISLGYLHQLFDEGYGLIDDGLKIFSSVADLCQRETTAIEV